MEIARKQEITHQEFINQHWKPGIPCVFTRATEVWDTKGAFTPDWFRSEFGDRMTEVDGMEFSMKQVMDLIEGLVPGQNAPYPCKYHIEEQLPELMEMLSPLNLGYTQPNWLESAWFSKGNWGAVTELFIGGAGGQFPYIHLDYYHLSAWINQLYGHKEFTIWPRGQEKYLYPDPENPWKSLIDDYHDPDLERFPLYGNATPITFTIGPGETLFIPYGIWHSARSLEPSISVAFDLLNAQNFPEFLKDVWGFRKNGNMLKAAAVTGYATLAGVACSLGDLIGKKRAVSVQRV